MSPNQFSPDSPASAAQRAATTLIDITIPGLDLIVRVAVHESGGQPWVEIPGEAIDRDGSSVSLRFSDPGTANAFMQRVPTALDGGTS